LKAAHDIRETFGRMAMNDEETVALIAGGHTFGKCHGAVAQECLGPEPEGCPVEQQGPGWKHSCRSGKGPDTLTSGIEGPWTEKPTHWDNGYLDNLFNYDWERVKSPAGAWQWAPTDPAAAQLVPDTHDPSKRIAPIMLTTDIALKQDPIYLPIAKPFHAHPDQLADAFAKAWCKLLHRDMGPVSRYLGPLVPEPQLWQDPLPEVDHPLIEDDDIDALKGRILDSGVSVSELIATAWAAASSFRGTDMRGGANGARIRLAPQKDWEANDPQQLARVLAALGRITGLQCAGPRRQPGLARRPHRAGWLRRRRAGGQGRRPGNRRPLRTGAHGRLGLPDRRGVVQRAGADRRWPPQLPPSRRSADAPAAALGPGKPVDANLARDDGARRRHAGLGRQLRAYPHGVLTDRPGTLTNDFFVNLLDMGTDWQPTESQQHIYEGSDRATGEVRWTATSADLVFGSNSQLRAISEVYASEDAKEKFLRDFIAAWDKVMSLDRFDLARATA
jgi:catalase-peroxidase